jgi:hypothetical protein
MIPFFERELIRKYTRETLQEYERVRGKRITFPLDVGDVFDKLFGLETVFDDQGIINQCLGDGINGTTTSAMALRSWPLDSQGAVHLNSRLCYAVENFHID